MPFLRIKRCFSCFLLLFNQIPEPCPCKETRARNKVTVSLAVAALPVHRISWVPGTLTLTCKLSLFAKLFVCVCILSLLQLSLPLKEDLIL